MLKPSTTFKFVDNSAIPTIEENSASDIKPLFLQPASFDRGPEDIRVVSGTEFYKLYGKEMSYKRHGQPAIQAANIIDNGGELVVKRVVADDAALANAIIVATVSQGRAYKVDTITGKQVYIDTETGGETYEAVDGKGVANEKAMVNTAIIKYDVASVNNIKTLKEAVAYSTTLFKEKDATPVEGAGDQASWVKVDEILTDGGNCPIKETVPTVGEDDQETGTMTNVYYDIDTVLIDKNSNLFKVVVGNKVQLLGSGLSEYKYPLMVITDNGRGESSKRFNILCNFTLSKSVGFGMYELQYLGETGFDLEKVRFAADPDTICNGNSMSLTMAAKSMLQLKAEMNEEVAYAFLDKVSEFSGIEVSELASMDVLFGHTKLGQSVSQITIDTDGYILNSDYGIELSGGTNGLFGKAPFGTEEYTNQLVKFFEGVFDDSIYDQNRYHIEACVDANYPQKVKEKIALLVAGDGKEIAGREDFIYYRDFGFGCDDYAAVYNQWANNTVKSKFIADYFTTYDVIDPFTKKQVPVTIGYSIARLLVTHLIERRNTPFCGALYSITIPEAIEGTINYIPKVTPTVDQETQLCNYHINYASYLNNVLTIQTQLTSQLEETQCSHINNINTVQETIRDIRTLCPRIRGSFIDTTDNMEKYAKQIQDVIDKHRNEYNSIALTWTADDVLVNNKLFNAAIKVSFKNFIIAEVFTIYTENAIYRSDIV